MKLKLILLSAFFISILTANAQTVVGKWKTFDDETKEAKSIVEITERGGKIYGKVIEILNPAKKDIKCKNCSGADKDKPVLGLEILKGLSKDGKEVVVSYVKKYSEANVIPRRLKVKALDENSLYEVIETGEVFGGDELMYIGLEIGELMGDYQAKNWTLRKVD